MLSCGAWQHLQWEKKQQQEVIIYLIYLLFIPWYCFGGGGEISIIDYQFVI